MPSAHNTAALLFLLAVWLLWLFVGNRTGRARRYSTWFLVVLTPLALYVHMVFLLGQRALPQTSLDFYHYYIGPKYFAELGHTGLYEAHTIADYEDDRETYHPRVWLRVLDDYTLTHKALVVARRDEIVGRFTKERWQEFKSDVGAFRRADFDSRQVPRWTQDHGYNGSPLTTFINRSLASALPLEIRKFVWVVSWFDILMVIGSAVLIGSSMGAQWGLLFVISFALNPLNNYLTIGASYLRYVYFVSMALGIVALLRGRNVTGGILFAVSTHLRLFPILLPLALFASDLLRPERVDLLRARWSFYLSLAVAGVLILGLTSTMDTPDGENIWKSFYVNSRLHSEHESVNQLGLRYPFRYSEEANLAVQLQTEAAIDWVDLTRSTFERNVRWFYAAAASFLALSLVFLRRVRRAEESLFVGLVWLFVLMSVSSYDYLGLSLVPLMFRDDRRLWVPLAVSWIAVASLNYIPAAIGSIDWAFRAITLVVAAYFVTTLALRAFVYREPDVTEEAA